MRKIHICTASGVAMAATMNFRKTAEAIQEGLPIEANAERRGADIYVDTAPASPEESPASKMPFGTIAHRPPG